MGHKIHKPHLKTVQDARAVRTREALRRAMLRLLEIKPLEQITILDICEVSEVGYTTFFRHHPSKESLLDDVAAEEIGQLVGLTLPLAGNVDSHAASLALFTYVDDRRKLWSTLLTGGAERALRTEFLRIAREVAATRTRPGIWPPADIATILVVSSTIELLSWWLRQKKPLTIAEVADIHVRVILEPTVDFKQLPTKQVARRARAR